MKMRKHRIHYAPRTRWVYGSRMGAAHRVKWSNGKGEQRQGRGRAHTSANLDG